MRPPYAYQARIAHISAECGFAPFSILWVAGDLNAPWQARSEPDVRAESGAIRVSYPDPLSPERRLSRCITVVQSLREGKAA